MHRRPSGGVDVKMAAQILRPGVQHQGEGGEAAEPARIGGELAEG